jgi:hypothetical protein
MSEIITDELRGFAPHLDLGKVALAGWKEALLAIADRIDAEHERQLEVLYRDMSDAEYVKLPKDADGEYIHEHDKVDWRDHAGTWHENATVVALCNDGCYVMDGTVFHVHKSDIRHHHAPTVEDVLREFALACEDAGNAGPEVERIAAEYAAKLKLKEDA